MFRECGFNPDTSGPPGARSDLAIAFFMPFFVYIIYSPSLQRFYTGTTDDVSKRIEEHNSAKYFRTFTTRGIPWELFFQIECKTSDQAYKLEKFITKMKSSTFNNPVFCWRKSKPQHAHHPE